MLRARLSYANVTATLALFVALGGSTYAATRIHGKDIAPRTITAKNIKRGTLTEKELARGSVTAAKLSPGVRALLPSGDFGDPGAEPLPGLDGLPGPPGDPGPQGEPGIGGGCPPELGLLCGEADLPAGDTATITGTQLVATAYRITCTRPGTGPSSCVVLLAGALPATAAATVYANPSEREMRLVVGPSGGPADRTVVLANAEPTALVTQSERWQLTLDAASATG